MIRIDSTVLLLQNIIDFKEVAVEVEKRLATSPFTRLDKQWMSMKAVSHFNLGIALELLLKFLLLSNSKEFKKRGHTLVALHDLLPPRIAKQLEDTYQKCFQRSGGFKMAATITIDKGKMPPKLRNRDISTIRGILEYFDRDRLYAERRYAYEDLERGKWLHFIDDISAFTLLVETVTGEVIDDYESKGLVDSAGTRRPTG